MKKIKLSFNDLINKAEALDGTKRGEEVERVKELTKKGYTINKEKVNGSENDGTLVKSYRQLKSRKNSRKNDKEVEAITAYNTSQLLQDNKDLFDENTQSFLFEEFQGMSAKDIDIKVRSQAHKYMTKYNSAFVPKELWLLGLDRPGITKNYDFSDFEEVQQAVKKLSIDQLEALNIYFFHNRNKRQLLRAIKGREYWQNRVKSGGEAGYGRLLITLIHTQESRFYCNLLDTLEAQFNGVNQYSQYQKLQSIIVMVS